MNLTTKSSFLPWLALIITVLSLVALGCWQVQRLQWKETLMAQYEAGLAEPPVPLVSLPAESLEQESYRRVTVSGTFIHDKEIHLGGRRWHGKTGYQLLTPLRLEDGRFFLVNRGWVPFELKDASTRPDSIAQPLATSLNAVIRTPKPANFLMPENHPEKNFWFYADIPVIREVTGLDLEPIVLEAYDDAPDMHRFPIPAEGTRIFRNDHLGYALTWFSLSLAAMVIFYFRFLRQPKTTGARG